MKNDVHASAYGSDGFQNIRIPHAAQPGIKKRKKIKKSVDKPVSLCYDIKAVRNTGCCETACGLVAQLDRVFDYESKGRGFESRRAHHVTTQYLIQSAWFFFLPIEARKS